MVRNPRWCVPSKVFIPSLPLCASHDSVLVVYLVRGLYIRHLATLLSLLGKIVSHNVQGIALTELSLQLTRVCLSKVPVWWGRKTASVSQLLLSDIWPISPQRQIFHLPTQPLCFCSGYRRNRCMAPEVTVLVSSMLLGAWELSSSSGYNKTGWDCFTKAVGPHRAKGSQTMHWLLWLSCWSWGGREELLQLVFIFLPLLSTCVHSLWHSTQGLPSSLVHCNCFPHSDAAGFHLSIKLRSWNEKPF